MGSGPNSLNTEEFGFMGVTLKTTSFKFSDLTLSKLDRLRDRFSLITANRTQVCRLAIDVLELIALTPATMSEVVKGIQGLCGVTSFPLQAEFRFPAADSAAQGGAGSDCSGGDLAVRPRVVVSINHRRESRQMAALADVEARAYTSPSFPAMYRYGNHSTWRAA